jgi:hypothetical protein
VRRYPSPGQRPGNPAQIRTPRAESPLYPHAQIRIRAILQIKGVPTTTIHFKIDEELIQEARRLGQHETQEAAVTAALEAYIQHRKQLEILDLFGTIDFHEDYDCKKNRQLDRIEIDP